MEGPDGADNCFNPEPGHICDLLTGKIDPVTFGADILVGLFKIGQ